MQFIEFVERAVKLRVSFRSGCTNVICRLSKQALEALYSIVAQKSVIARMKKISQSRFLVGEVRTRLLM